jgi:hypothetical protein
MNRIASVIFAIFAPGFLARAQFSTKWLQDENYWGDGKAEFNIYDAQEVRYGQPRACEVLHIVVREPFAPRELVKTENGAQAGAYPVLKLNQVLHIPTGVYVYQQMHSAFWRTRDGQLIKATLTSNDSCGNTYKEFAALTGARAWLGRGWSYAWRTYWEGMSGGEETIRAPDNGFFADELPMRVRTVDFSKGDQGEFGIHLARTVINSKKDDVKFAPATVHWRRTTDRVTVAVRRGEERQEFILEQQPPYRLLGWTRQDGASAKLRRSVKIDYWNYNKVGDKDRALNSAPTDKK